MDQSVKHLDALTRRIANRRRFLANSGLIGAAALGSGLLGLGGGADAAEHTTFGAKGHRVSVNDYDILNFALNLEYLESQYFLIATTGSGLTAAETSGVIGSGKKPNAPGTPGTVTGGSQVPFAVPEIQEFAQKIAADEKAHVDLLRAALGDRAVAMPAIDLVNSFNDAAIAAGIITTGSTFDPFASDDNFLLGAFLFEDVGVTAYLGAAPYISKSAYLVAAGGILGAEAYHAGAVRSTLLTRGQTNPALIATANQISALRAKADGSPDGGNESPLTTPTFSANIAATDANGLCFPRTFAEVLSIVYLGGTTSGGFFPDGMNGPIS